MVRIDAAEIRSLVTRTNADDARWQVDGRRFRHPGYLLFLRSGGGSELSRADGHGRTWAAVRSRLGFLPRGRAVRALARAVERQVVRADRAASRFRRVGGDRPVIEAGPASVGDRPIELDEVTLDPAPADVDLTGEGSPIPSRRSPSGRSGPSDPDPASG